MNLKLQEKDASALFLALDEIVNFDLYKRNKFSPEERDSIVDIYIKITYLIRMKENLSWVYINK